MLTNVSANNIKTQLVKIEQHAFEQNSNVKSFNNNSLYVTELDYTLLTEKKIDSKLGLMQVKIPTRKNVRCVHCHKEMEIQEGTVIYNKQWFHDSCWHETINGPNTL